MTSRDGFDIAVQTVRASERCAICTTRAAGSMLAFRERPQRSMATSVRRTWLLCAACAPAVVAEVDRAALRTPFRLRIAVGMVAAERRAPRRLAPREGDFRGRLPAERTDKVVIGFVLALFALVPLLFLLALALATSGVFYH